MKNIATPFHRLVAALIDSLIWITLVIFVFYQITLATSLQSLLSQILAGIISLMAGQLFMGLITSWLTSSLGGSIGKILTGLKVVDVDGNNISFKKSLFRQYVGYAISAAFVFLGYIWILKDKNRQAWHDQFVNTFVVTKYSTGIVTGIISLVALIALNIYLIMTSFATIKLNLPFYQHTVMQVALEVKDAIEPTPTPMPISTVTPSPTLRPQTPAQTAPQVAKPAAPGKQVATEQSVILSDLSAKLNGSALSPYKLSWTNSDDSNASSDGYSVTVTASINQIADYFVKNGFAKINEAAWSKNNSVCAVLSNTSNTIEVGCVPVPDVK